MISPELAEKLKSSPDWQALEAHIQECITAMDSCSSIADSDDHDKVARGRKEAVRVLRRILEPFYINPTASDDLRKKSLQKLGIEE